MSFPRRIQNVLQALRKHGLLVLLSALAVAAAALWMRCRNDTLAMAYHYDSQRPGQYMCRYIHLTLRDNSIYLTFINDPWTNVDPASPRPPTWLFNAIEMWHMIPLRRDSENYFKGVTNWRFVGIGIYPGGGIRRRTLFPTFEIHFVWVVYLLGLYPFVRAWRAGEELIRSRHKQLCPQCGYDLRGSSHTCPECGRPIDKR